VVSCYSAANIFNTSNGPKISGDMMASTKLSRLKSLLDSVACLSDLCFVHVIKKLIISRTIFLVAVR
jgi:hypothetical protein